MDQARPAVLAEAEPPRRRGRALTVAAQVPRPRARRHPRRRQAGRPDLARHRRRSSAAWPRRSASGTAARSIRSRPASCRSSWAAARGSSSSTSADRKRVPGDGLLRCVLDDRRPGRRADAGDRARADRARRSRQHSPALTGPISQRPPAYSRDQGRRPARLRDGPGRRDGRRWPSAQVTIHELDARVVGRHRPGPADRGRSTSLLGRDVHPGARPRPRRAAWAVPRTSGRCAGRQPARSRSADAIAARRRPRRRRRRTRTPLAALLRPDRHRAWSASPSVALDRRRGRGGRPRASSSGPRPASSPARSAIDCARPTARWPPSRSRRRGGRLAPGQGPGRRRSASESPSPSR